MNANQKLLIDLLSVAIRGQKQTQINSAKINWIYIFEEAKAHHVDALLYPIIQSLDTIVSPCNELMTEWQKKTVLTGMMQIQHIEKVAKLLHKFNESGIKVLVLKGLVIREYYPRPELRSMSDSDILIHKEDINHIRKLLEEMGYTERESNSIHIMFSHKFDFPVEVHWSLVDHNNFKGIECFEGSIWNNAIPINICNVPALGLSLEDQLLYLCMHMAAHALDSGFGLRQLCDLVLQVEATRETTDWELFYAKSKECGMERFIWAVFIVCNQLLNLEIPREFNSTIIEDKYYIEMLINDIFSGGVYGKRGTVRMNGNSLLHYSYHQDTNHLLGKIKRYVDFIFPSNERLGKRYEYLKRYPFLTPVGWLHRLIRYILRKDYSLIEKVTLLFRARSIAKRRDRLLQWLALR
jgi:hypothetical protein